MSLVTVGQVLPSALWFSIPIGLCTEAILVSQLVCFFILMTCISQHVNNVRDVAADARAGATTLAMKLPTTVNTGLYVCPEACKLF